MKTENLFSHLTSIIVTLTICLCLFKCVDLITRHRIEHIELKKENVKLQLELYDAKIDYINGGKR